MQRVRSSQSDKRKRLCRIKFSVLILLFTISLAHADQLIFDGGFESGTLQGWVSSAENTAIVVRSGSCFSGNDTRALPITGQYAGLLRSGPHLKNKPVAPASFTSKQFKAGNGLMFTALSERSRKAIRPHPFAITVSILDKEDNVLESQPMVTAGIELAPGCPSNQNGARFSRHFVNTQHHQGKLIKLRISQHPDTARTEGFTLIDQVTHLDQNDSRILYAYPLAKAGFVYDRQSQLAYLTAAIPGGNVGQTQDWEYSWRINGENQPRNYFNPCISDLKPGHYTATLVVRSADIRASDTLHFDLPDFSIDSAGENASTTPSTAVCNRLHPLEPIEPITGASAHVQ